jgi:hypothetical protein
MVPLFQNIVDVKEFCLLGYNVMQSVENFLPGSLLGLFFDPEDGKDIPPRHWLIFNRLHDVTFPKIQLFITTPVGTLNPTSMLLLFMIIWSSIAQPL